ncbi:MAG: thiamine biosynthesis protein ApbE [Pseudopedobacter saltans]|uniref:FAD:protein FMN transferase n=1 Tax=Pseudopedobacter saltans TaxID=151895 RepID=A0A2W5GV66_9SPHI|nr:MAG: thiamine biosynthesis protein ApbE [Pseudopedobacter saltans]
MGGKFGITVVAKDRTEAFNSIDTIIKEVSRIEYLISDWKQQTQVSAINRNAGIAPVKVDKEVLELTKRAIRLSEITGGAFDISFAAMEKIWHFDGSDITMPDSQKVKDAVRLVGYRNIIIDTIASTIFLKNKGMKIGFGALGEGFAVDVCRRMMLEKGIKAGLINATGDIGTWGKQKDGKDWTIGVTNPFDPMGIMDVVNLAKGSVTTSGSYEKYVMIDGKRYAHIINPKTGYPSTGLCSVTIFGPSTEFCNGLSTSIMVLGIEKGKKLLQQFPAYSAVMITDNGKIVKTKNSPKLRKY